MEFKNIQLFLYSLLFLYILVPHQLHAQCGTTTIVGSGAQTWTAPAGTTSVTVEAWGGGGGGGSGTGTRGAGGGGGGAYASSTLVVVPGVTYNLVVGSGGNKDANGTASSFGTTLVIAAGGSKGTLATSSSGATGQGAGGTVAASVGTIRYAGGNGGGASNNDGGGGGGAAGSGGAGGNGGNGCSCSSGPGGTWGEGGTFGSGRGGRGGSDSPDSVAVCGFSPGGGGGGSEDESDEDGAVGGSGQVILTYTSTACPSGATIVYSGATLITMTSASTKTICTGTSTNIPLRSTSGTKFIWIAAANANVTGESTTRQTSNTINNTLTNTTSVVQTVSYTVTPVPSCNTSGVAQVLLVTVNPLPTMNSPTAATICSGAAVNIPLTATTSTTTATTFSWIAANNANTSGESTTAQPTSTINNTIVNSSTSNQTVTYTVTPANSCGSGVGQVVSVLVKAPPVLSSTLTPSAVCSGTAFTYTATSTSSSPTFAWSRATVVGISNGASSGTTGIINETLMNTTSAAINVTYVFTTTSDCAGSPQNVVVSIKPSPTLSSTLTPTAICSGATFNYQATSATSGATFSWARATVAGITPTGTSPSSTNPVNEVLTNTTGVAINVTYTYTTTANTCSSVQNVVVSVKGATRLSSTLTPAAICSGTALSYTATSSNGSASFAWSRAAVAGISEALASGTSNPLSDVALTNTTAAAVDVVYVYTTTANGCSGTDNVTVSVKPAPQLNSALTDALCSGSTFAYTPTSGTAGPPSFSWTRNTPAGITSSPVATSGTSDISQTLSNSTTAAVAVTYTYTTTLNGCSGATQNLVVTVNPIPVLNSATSATVCSGATFTYTASSATTGATYTWSRAAVTGIINGAASGTTSVSEILVNTTTAAVSVNYFYTTTANTCSNAGQNVTVTVNPLPVLTSTLTATAICSGTAFAYDAASATAGSTFAWSRVAIAGISSADPSSGTTDPISHTLTNSTAAAIDVTYTYTTTANGCSGASQNVVVSVLPSPQGELFGNTVCTASSDIPQFTFQSTAGTGPYTLVVATGQTVPNPVTSNVPWAANPAPSLAVDATFTYTLTSITGANGCVRTTAISVPTASITVIGSYSYTAGTPASKTTCSGTTTSFSVTATGVQTYGWEVNTTGANGGTYNVAGPWVAITGTEPSPTYSGYTSAILDVSNANTTHNGTRYRSVLIPACGATAYSDIAILTVNPVPLFTSSLAPSPATCSGTTLIYTPAGTGIGNVTFTWTRAAVPNITTAAASSGSGAITTHTLTNSTASPIDVTYVFIAADDGNNCSSASQNVVFTINPKPTLSSVTGTVASLCSPATFTYTPNSATIGATYAWSRNTPGGITSVDAATSGTAGISQILTNSLTANVDVTYTYTTTANTCSSDPQTVVVTVKPLPVLSSTLTATAICSAVNNLTYTVTSATAGATFDWTRGTVAGISEVGTSGSASPIAETLTNTTNAAVTVTYSITTTASGCSGASQNVTVSVKPTPIISSANTQSVCSGVLLTYNPSSNIVAGVSYAWTRNALPAGITSPDPNSGTASISQTLTNSTTSPINVTYVYTATAASCAGLAENIVITVNPTPSLTSTATPSAVCSETAVAFAYTATSDVSGATYAWTRPAIATINANAAGSGTGNISEVLTSTSTSSVTVTYTFTTTANGCVGASTQNVAVVVKPRPVLSSSATSTVCSGSAITYSATSATGAGAATYSWSRAAVTGISNAAATGSANPIGESLNNTTSAPIDVPYIYTTTFDGCASASANTVTVTVIPSPVMTSAATATICTGTSISSVPLTFASDMASTYAWTRAAIATINTNNPGSGTGNVAETLTSSSTAPVSVTYVVTPTSNPGGCPGTAQNVVIEVSPLPAQPNAINANPN